MKNEKLITDAFTNCFTVITKTLKLKKHPYFDGQYLSSITKYFKNNKSVLKIKGKFDSQENSFSFTLFTKENINAKKSLSSNKAFPFDDIPVKVLKNSIHIYSEKLTKMIDGQFPDTLKRADITPIF